MKKYLELLRVRHYIKNLIIFLPLFLSGRLFEKRQNFYDLAVGFLLFCIATSIVYIINDIKDKETDSRHPVKKSRPIASGRISVKQGILVVCILLGCFLGVYFLYSPNRMEFFSIPFIYLGVNLSYSFFLKKVPLVDISILMLGYLLRLEYGGLLIHCEISTWVFLTMMSVAFFMGIGKRRGELIRHGDEYRASIKFYSLGFLNNGMNLAMSSALVFYALACADTNSVAQSKQINLLWTVPFVFVMLLRYLILIEDEKCDGDPITVIFSDRYLLGLIIVFSIIVSILLYV